MTNELLGTVEAAEVIGCERSTLSRWITAGRIAPLKKLPGRNGAVLFSRAEVDRVAAIYATERTGSSDEVSAS
ncbi:MAG TPA: helix-turn-helix domain-containing protein [Microthrixaceae bacterium]|jgi:excisionase family DNA binding protein|nr:helix-turn-helix domain-containing protein [Microthrixaceae bacterium]